MSKYAAHIVFLGSMLATDEFFEHRPSISPGTTVNQQRFNQERLVFLWSIRVAGTTFAIHQNIKNAMANMSRESGSGTCAPSQHCSRKVGPLRVWCRC